MNYMILTPDECHEIVTRATLTRRRVSRNRDTRELYSETSVTNS